MKISSIKKATIRISLLSIFGFLFCYYYLLVFYQVQAKDFMSFPNTNILRITTSEEKDTNPPKIVFEKKFVNSNDSYLFFASNERLLYSTNDQDDSIKYIQQHEGSYIYLYEARFSDDEDEIELLLSDESRNQTQKQIVSDDDQNPTISSPEKDNLYQVIDKSNGLSEFYYPKDLVYVSEYDIPAVYNGFLLREVMIEDLEALFRDAKNAGFYDLLVGSAYRSYAKQADVYNFCLATKGAEETAKYCAKPGFSEHQLGTAIDFLSTETNKFEQTRVSKWLEENAYKYGFVQSYPAGSSEVTGYEYEAWHYRFIGKNDAEKLHKQQMLPILYLRLENFRQNLKNEENSM